MRRVAISTQARSYLNSLHGSGSLSVSSSTVRQSHSRDPPIWIAITDKYMLANMISFSVTIPNVKGKTMPSVAKTIFVTIFVPTIRRIFLNVGNRTRPNLITSILTGGAAINVSTEFQPLIAAPNVLFVGLSLNRNAKRQGLLCPKRNESRHVPRTVLEMLT